MQPFPSSMPAKQMQSRHKHNHQPVSGRVSGAAGTEPVKYDALCRAVAEAAAVDEVRKILNVSAAQKAYAKQANNKQLEADAAAIRMRATRRLGELMKLQAETVGLSTGARMAGKNSAGVPQTRRSVLPTLKEAGINKSLAHRARQYAAMPPDQFEQVVSDVRSTVERGVERQVLRAVEIAEARRDYEARREAGGTVEDLHALAASGKRFPVILVDLPWEFQTYSRKGKQRGAERYYDTMSLDDMKALPVEQLASENCVLFLWGLWELTPAALDVIRAWGFEFKSLGFNWIKQNKTGGGLFMGKGYLTRSGSEACWIATRGNPLRLAADVRQVIIAPVGDRHSAKPDEIHKRIERLFAGPYLELFARAERPNWTTWGNEIAETRVLRRRG
jgi:N6-adenosine-specific RNA methylase IME4